MDNLMKWLISPMGRLEYAINSLFIVFASLIIIVFATALFQIVDLETGNKDDNLMFVIISYLSDAPFEINILDSSALKMHIITLLVIVIYDCIITSQRLRDFHANPLLGVWMMIPVFGKLTFGIYCGFKKSLNDSISLWQKFRIWLYTPVKRLPFFVGSIVTIIPLLLFVVWGKSDNLDYHQSLGVLAYYVWFPVCLFLNLIHIGLHVKRFVDINPQAKYPWLIIFLWVVPFLLPEGIDLGFGFIGLWIAFCIL